MRADEPCPDCGTPELNRRHFLKTSAVAAAAMTGVSALPNWAVAKDAAEATSSAAKSAPESLVKVLYETFTPKQKEELCFDWDYQDKKGRGLLRTFVANNWQITEPSLHEDYFTKDQKKLVREIFEGIVHPDWHKRIDKQLEDDAGGFGHDQSIALFGKPGDGKFEFVMTGRHMTMRCDGNSADSVAFGGPIFYGHAASDSESADHPGNVFWPQAAAANKIFDLLDTKQQAEALLANRPTEQSVSFQGAKAKLPGLAVSELSKDTQGEVQKLLGMLLGMYRQSDQAEALECIKKQGGLEKCSLAFYKQGNIGNDKVWDNWRLEGPSFVWYFRGSPHVHVWVNVADSSDVKTNSVLQKVTKS